MRRVKMPDGIVNREAVALAMTMEWVHAVRYDDVKVIVPIARRFSTDIPFVELTEAEWHKACEAIAKAEPSERTESVYAAILVSVEEL